MNVRHWLKMAWKKLLRLLGLKPWPKPPVPKPGPVVPKPGEDTPIPPVEDKPIPLPRLTPQGRFWTAGGQRVDWRAMTAFRLLQLVADGKRGEAADLMDWARDYGLNILRVLSMKGYGGAMGTAFELSPADGLKVLPEALALADAHRMYLQVVCLADTAHYRIDYPAHVEAIGGILSEHANGIPEIANEPYHGTQDSRLHDPAYLRGLRTLIPPTIPVALGAASSDESDEMRAGADWIAVHILRDMDADNGWKWVRHAREALWDGKLNRNVPTVNNEPPRTDTAGDKAFALGCLEAMLGAGACVHHSRGLLALPPEGEELSAFLNRRAGWSAVGQYEGLYYPTTFSHALRVYSSRNEREGWALGLDCGSDVEWKVPDGYRATLAGEVGRARLWRLAR